MRWNLSVPYAEKDEAKARGAMWDAKGRVWYVKNPDAVEVLSRWNPQKVFYEANSKVFKVTEPTGCYLPVCSCAVLPWEECEHTGLAQDRVLEEQYQIIWPPRG